MPHFVPDIKHRIQSVKQVHVFSKSSMLGLGLIVCSRLPTNERKQLGSLCGIKIFGTHSGFKWLERRHLDFKCSEE